MNLNEAVSALANYEAFSVYLAYIKGMREQGIADMHAAPTETLQQISGRILAYNDILAMSDSDRVFRIHRKD